MPLTGDLAPGRRLGFNSEHEHLTSTVLELGVGQLLGPGAWTRPHMRAWHMGVITAVPRLSALEQPVQTRRARAPMSQTKAPAAADSDAPAAPRIRASSPAGPPERRCGGASGQAMVAPGQRPGPPVRPPAGAPPRSGRAAPGRGPGQTVADSDPVWANTDSFRRPTASRRRRRGPANRRPAGRSRPVGALARSDRRREVWPRGSAAPRGSRRR